jgi:hypothetical protein
MTTQLTIRSTQDIHFRNSCAEQSIKFVCVSEFEDGNRYEITCDDFELYYLGVNMGLKVGLGIAIDNVIKRL